MPTRTLAIGDIHGTEVALDIMLTQLAPSAEDTLIVLGDVVDRGPGSSQCVEMLIAASHNCRLVLIMGNHEEMLLEALSQSSVEKSWLAFGGQETIHSYGGDKRNIPVHHVEFLQSGLQFWETDTQIFIHANLQPDVALEEQTRDWLRWTHLSGEEKPHPSGKQVICGHTPQLAGYPLVLDGWICLDTCAYGGGFLSCLDVETGIVHQSNQQGRFRSFNLADLLDI